jgi:hypothetical protein
MAWLEDAEKSVRVMHSLEGLKLGDLLALEDADHTHLCTKIRAASWSVIDERVLRFCHTVLNASEWPVDASEFEREGLREYHAEVDPGKNGGFRATARRLDRKGRTRIPG